MSRCVGCDKILSEMELLGTKPDGNPEDMCFRCIVSSSQEYSYVFDKEYLFQNIREGVTPAAPVLP